MVVHGNVVITGRADGDSTLIDEDVGKGVSGDETTVGVVGAKTLEGVTNSSTEGVPMTELASGEAKTAVGEVTVVDAMLIN